MVFAIPPIFFIIIAIAIAFVILVGPSIFFVKIIQLLFFGEIGEFPLWALWVVTIIGFLIYRKSKKRRDYR